MAKKKKSTDNPDSPEEFTPDVENEVAETEGTPIDKVDQLVAACKAMKAKFELGHTIVNDDSYDRYPGLAGIIRALKNF